MVRSIKKLNSSHSPRRFAPRKQRELVEGFLPFREDTLLGIAIIKRYALGRGVLSASLNKGLCTLQSTSRAARRQLALDEVMRSGRK